MWEAIKQFFDAYTPRFITEDAVCRIVDRVTTETEIMDAVEIVKPLHWVEDGEDFDYIITVRFFNLFGRAIGTQWVGDPRRFVKSEVVKMRSSS